MTVPAPTPASTAHLVDVTLRDGGYHCGWSFRPELIDALIRALDLAGLDWIELGYREPPRDSITPLRSFDESRVDRLATTKRLGFALMVEAKSFVGRLDLVPGLFRPRTDSRVGLVRIATRLPDLPTALQLTDSLAELGYTTALNLIDATTIVGAPLHAALPAIVASPVSVLTLADSLGDAYPDDIAAWFTKTRAALQETSRPHFPLGAHLHDALGLAFANALTALAHGANWLDVSVLGIGRGPGNLRTEAVLHHLEHHSNAPQRQTRPVLDFITAMGPELEGDQRWPLSSLAYAYAARLGLHPSYPQAVIERFAPDLATIISKIELLANRGAGRSFDAPLLAALLGPPT